MNDTNIPSVADDDVVKTKRFRHPDLTIEEKDKIISNLLRYLKTLDDEDYPLERGAMKRVAKKFHVSRAAISRIWIEAKKNKNNPVIDSFVCYSYRNSETMSRFKWDRNAFKEEIKLLSQSQRRSMSSLAKALHMPKSTISYLCRQEGVTIRLDESDYSSNWLDVKK